MEHVNDVFADFAAAFIAKPGPHGGPAREQDDEIVHPRHLDRDRLGHSLASLKAVDDYLSHLHGNRPAHGGADWNRTILWTGAYVGEVIRRNAARPYDWVDFDDFVREHPRSASILGERDLGVCAVLSTGNGGFTLPINKVLKFIVNGPEDGVAFYAAAECRNR